MKHRTYFKVFATTYDNLT